MPKLAKLRLRAFVSQSGRCFYCGLPMFVSSPEEIGLSASCRRLKATAEHLQARSDGGSDIASNIAAACLHCNSLRHRSQRPLDAQQYAERVRRRVAAGRWHPKHVFDALRALAWNANASHHEANAAEAGR